ncbi:MAG: nucleoside hydrolase [Deltaproteobacteria bacterium]|nr:nucleoside hydrolase [Deltaproteobacteria bacterium]
MERECKLIFQDDALASGIFNILSKTPSLRGYHSHGKQEWTIEDIYFDTPNLALEDMNCVCRIRRVHDDSYLELKKRTVSIGYKACYEKKRFPMNSPLSSQVDEIREKVGNFASLDQNSKEIAPILRVKTNRTELHWGADFSDSFFLMHLDKVEYFFPESKEVIETHFEIELKEEPDGVHVDVFREILRNLFGLIPIRRAKLARCSRLLRKKDRLPQKIILDMDPGVDDALAIFLAMNSPEIEVLAITAVGGNIDVESSARNARIVLDFLRQRDNNLSIPPVAIGCQPLDAIRDASDVHGCDGLGGISCKWGEPKVPLSKDGAVEIIRKLTEKYPNEITIVATGPLTNIARCIEQYPDAVRQVKELVVMGGVFFESGNRTQAAEFNIHTDPKAAKKVLDFSRGFDESMRTPLTFVGLDVTHQVRLRREWVHSLANKGNETAQFVRKITKCYMDFYKKNEGLNGCYLHDPLAIAYVIEPTLCEVERYHVEIETEGEFTSGMTVADYRPTQIFREEEKEITGVCIKVDASRFEQLFMRQVFGDVI